MASHKYLTLEGLSIFKDNIMSIIEDNELTIAAALNRIPLDIRNGVQTAVSNMIQPASALQYELTKENASGNATIPRAFYMLVNNKSTDTGDYYYTTSLKSYDREGILTTTTQTISGEKQFADNIRILNDYYTCDPKISGAGTGYIYFGNPEWGIKNDAYISYGLSMSNYACDDIDATGLNTYLSIRNKNSTITLNRNNIEINTNVSLPSNKTIKIGDVNVSLEGHTHEFNINGSNGTLETILSNLSSSLNTHISTGSHVPTYSSSEINKVLGISGGTNGITPTLSWVPGLPTYNTTNDKDKFLHIKSDGSVIEWASLPVASETSSGIVSKANQKFAGMKTFCGGLQTNIISAQSTDSSISSKLYVQDVKDLYLQFAKTSAAASTIHLTNTNLFVDGATYDKAIKIAGNYVYLNGQIMLNDTPIEDLLGNTDLPIASGFHIPTDDGTGLWLPTLQTMSSGILTTENQSIAGEKHFNDGIRLVNLKTDYNEYYMDAGSASSNEGIDPFRDVPDGHTGLPKIWFGPNNNTFIGEVSIDTSSIGASSSTYNFYDKRFLEIQSAGFNNVLLPWVDDRPYGWSGFTNMCSVSRSKMGTSSLLYSTIISSSSSNYAPAVGKLTKTSGTDILTMTSCPVSTMTPYRGQYSLSLDGLLGGESIQLSLKDCKYYTRVGLSSASTYTSTPYAVNSGTFACNTVIYYKFDTDSNWRIMDVTFSGQVSNKGYSSKTTGTTELILSADPNYHTINVTVPTGAKTIYWYTVPFAPQSAPTSPTSCTSITIYCTGVTMFGSSLSTGGTAVGAGYPYLMLANYSTGVGILGVKGNYGSIRLMSATAKLNFVGGEKYEKMIFGNGITCLTYNRGSGNDVGNHMHGTDQAKYHLRSAIIIGDKTSNGKASNTGAFAVLESKKLYLHSNFGETYISSIGLHRQHSHLASMYNTNQHLYISVPGDYDWDGQKYPGNRIIFGLTTKPDILHEATASVNTDLDTMELFTGGASLTPAEANCGSVGTLDYPWGNIYGKTVTITGNCTAKTFIQSSDAELKTIKGDVDVDLDRLKEIPKIFFKYNEDDDNITRIGTIAQDVQKIYPEIVHTDDDGYLSLEYDKLSVISLKAIDKLYDRQLELENEIKELKEIVLKILNK